MTAVQLAVGMVIQVPEDSYRYGAGDLVLRLTKVGRAVPDDKPRAAWWVPVDGHVLHPWVHFEDPVVRGFLVAVLAVKVIAAPDAPGADTPDG